MRTNKKNIKHMLELIFRPNIMNELDKLKPNILAYGTLEYLEGSIVSNLNSNIMDLIDQVSNFNSSEIIDILLNAEGHLKSNSTPEQFRKLKPVLNQITIIALHRHNKQFDTYKLK